MVLDDTALRARRTTRLRALLAHELGHVQRRHTLRGVLWFGVIGLPALCWCWRSPSARPAAASMAARDPRAAPLVVAASLVAAALLTPVENG